jgi:uncharacterized membrane protein YqhA
MSGDGPHHPPHGALGSLRGSLFEGLLRVRYVAVVVVILSLLHSVTFLVIGARSALRTYHHVLLGTEGERMERPGLELLHSLDFFLVSLVLMILAVGVAKLFLLPAAAAHRPANLPSWLDVESFTDLKVLLWETILTTMLVAAIPIFTTAIGEKMEWSALVMPAAILLLALSLYLMKKH